MSFASVPDEKTDLFSSLGLDWTLLVLQTVAFLILLVILRIFVYPPLMAMLDKREAELRQSAQAAEDVKKHAQEAEAKTAALLALARTEASDIVATAREEASGAIEAAHQKAADKADALIAAAKDEISKEVEFAKQALQGETLELVASASGTILREKITAQTDAKLIAKALKEAN